MQSRVNAVISKADDIITQGRAAGAQVQGENFRVRGISSDMARAMIKLGSLWQSIENERNALPTTQSNLKDLLAAIQTQLTDCMQRAEAVYGALVQVNNTGNQATDNLNAQYATMRQKQLDMISASDDVLQNYVTNFTAAGDQMVAATTSGAFAAAQTTYMGLLTNIRLKISEMVGYANDAMETAQDAIDTNLVTGDLFAEKGIRSVLLHPDGISFDWRLSQMLAGIEYEITRIDYILNNRPFTPDQTILENLGLTWQEITDARDDLALYA